MSQRNRNWSIIIVLLVIIATYGALASATSVALIDRNVSIRQGLDLSGGSQVLLQAADCNDPQISDRLDNARQIIEKRVNSLGVSEPLVQLQGNCRILVELPSIDNPADALALIQQTGSLEFVDAGLDFYNEGAVIRTSRNPTPTLAISATQSLSNSLATTLDTTPTTAISATGTSTSTDS